MQNLRYFFDVLGLEKSGLHFLDLNNLPGISLYAIEKQVANKNWIENA